MNIDLNKNQKESLDKLSTCLICGDQAHIINYGALSCSSCKTFFRCNALHIDSIRRCLRQNACQLTKETRRICRYCRLKKCFSVGMDSDLIRKEDKRCLKYSSSNKSNRNRSLLSKQSISISQLPTLDLLHNDRSNLSTTDWTLLSNVVYGHDRFSRANEFRYKFIDDCSSSKKIQFDLIHAIDFVNSSFLSMHLFIRSVPYFQVLTLNEQNSLIERNLFGTAGLSSLLLSRESGILDNSCCKDKFQQIYGFELTKQTEYINRQLDIDSTIVKLMLVIIAFSTAYLILNLPEHFRDDSLLFGTHRLFGSQNVFVEILWKYMNHRYGLYDCVHRFTQLVSIILNLIKYSAIAYTTNEIHHNLVDNIIEETKETLTISQNEEFPLWGKQ